MRSWTIKEVKLVLEWAGRCDEDREPFDELASKIRRSSAAVQQFLRRTFPEGKRPWVERPRWQKEERDAVRSGVIAKPCRSQAAIQKFMWRHGASHLDRPEIPEDSEHTVLTIKQVAADLGVSRATVYRFLERGILRRFKGGIAETSFADLLHDHPDAIPYARLPRSSKEWLVLNGYLDPSLAVKRPTTKGLLD